MKTNNFKKVICAMVLSLAFTGVAFGLSVQVPLFTTEQNVKLPSVNNTAGPNIITPANQVKPTVENTTTNNTSTVTNCSH